jgi:ABC-type nitrate/sulfonate/bicarbonate transport system substrate-binding protein
MTLPKAPTPSRLQRVRLIVFPGGHNWPVWVAQELGYFADNAIDLEVTPTPGSVFQLTGLIEGSFDLAITLIDNVVAYREGQGEVPVVGPDLIAFMTADARVFPTLITLPEIKRYEDLRGHTLALDAMTTGYAFALIAMLERGGLKPDDYELYPLGGALERFKAMQEKRYAGALFNPPFGELLQAQGYNELDTAIGALGHYQGMSGAARAAWARDNRETVVGFIRAFLRAVAWIYDPANREAAFGIFHRNTPGARENAADVAHRVMFGAPNGFLRDGAVDLDGIRSVLDIRSKYGKPKRTLTDPMTYFDPSFLAQALNR